MDPAAEALQQHTRSEKVNYTALSVSSSVSKSTLWHRNHGRASAQERATHQQYLTLPEEKALVEYLLDMSHKGYPLLVKASRTLAHEIALRRTSNFQTVVDGGETRPPRKNWAQAFHLQHLELKAARKKAVNWERDDSHIFDEVGEWFSMASIAVTIPPFPS
jgi:hypothetical protein